MINREKIAIAAADARRAEKSYLSDAGAERQRGNEWRADMLEMDAAQAQEIAETAERKLMQISLVREDVEAYEGTTGREFDCSGPLPARCRSCRGFYQFPQDHDCPTLNIVDSIGIGTAEGSVQPSMSFDRVAYWRSQGWLPDDESI